MELEGVVHNGLIVPDNATVLPEGTRVRIVPAVQPSQSAGQSADLGQWSNESNERRIELIDKDIQGSLTAEERLELAELQRKAVAYRDRVAPLPIEGARRLHEQLLERKHQGPRSAGPSETAQLSPLAAEPTASFPHPPSSP